MAVDVKQMMVKIRSAVNETLPGAVAILYGSRATGKAKRNSDWDVLVLLNEPRVPSQKELQLRNNLYDLELETGERISSFIYTENEWNGRLSVTPFYRQVKQQGIVL